LKAKTIDRRPPGRLFSWCRISSIRLLIWFGSETAIQVFRKRRPVCQVRIVHTCPFPSSRWGVVKKGVYCITGSKFVQITIQPQPWN